MKTSIAESKIVYKSIPVQKSKSASRGTMDTIEAIKTAPSITITSPINLNSFDLDSITPKYATRKNKGELRKLALENENTIEIMKNVMRQKDNDEVSDSKRLCSSNSEELWTNTEDYLDSDKRYRPKQNDKIASPSGKTSSQKEAIKAKKAATKKGWFGSI